jgi:hypothetical protein
MRDWQEPQESLLPLVRLTASRLLGSGERRQTLAYFYHSLRRIVFRTRGVILVSMGKSGRTWLRFMLDDLGIHIQYTHVAGKLERPGDLNGRLIHLHRDPRDTVTSAWYQHRKRRGDYTGGFPEFLRDPQLGLERRVRFNLFWAEHVTRSGGLVTSYERLQADTMAELGRIVLFITGKVVGDAELGRAVAAGSFSRMRALEASGEGARLYGSALAPGDPGDLESYKTREGRIGTWRADFSAADAAFAERVLQEHDYFERMRDVSA